MIDSTAEWLEADGLGGFASGTASGLRTRRYHALLNHAAQPPTGRRVLVNGLEARLDTAAGAFALSSHAYLPSRVQLRQGDPLRSHECQGACRLRLAQRPAYFGDHQREKGQRHHPHDHQHRPAYFRERGRGVEKKEASDAQDREVAANAMREIAAYLAQVIREKSENPDGRVISTIAHARPDGVPLTEREVFGFVFFLFIGGLDTVFATLNNIWLWLANNPDRRREMINDPGNITAQVEELLRVYSVTYSGRMLTQDIEIRGVKMKKGDRVTAILPACNYDAEVFPNPTQVDFHRPRKPILAFAGGARCTGGFIGTGGGT